VEWALFQVLERLNQVGQGGRELLALCADINLAYFMARERSERVDDVVAVFAEARIACATFHSRVINLASFACFRFLLIVSVAAEIQLLCSVD
jgi:hypothetical protein